MLRIDVEYFLEHVLVSLISASNYETLLLTPYVLFRIPYVHQVSNDEPVPSPQQHYRHGQCNRTPWWTNCRDM
jgi:hypothetical protein